jgi:hypothetical protein
VKRFVYLNHRIHQAQPSGPVIVVQDETGDFMEANGFDLRFDGFRIGRIVFDPKGLPACKTHDVKAWLELAENVEVTPAGEVRKSANAKLPNRSITMDTLKLKTK